MPIASWMCAVALLPRVGTAGAAEPNAIENAAVIVRPVGSVGAWLGFDLIDRASGRLVAPVRFSSNGILFADRLGIERHSDGAVTAQSLRFGELRSRLGTGVTTGDHDFVHVTLRGDDPFPHVDFDLTVANFTVSEWELHNRGPCPFHFLTLELPDAEVWHQRGWLMATPRSDPFVLQQDVAFGGGSIASAFSRHWSYLCALGGSPMPVIGLWAPAARHYVGWEFQGARLSDSSERDVAAAYCWQHRQARQFVSLAFPHGAPKYRNLTYPPPKSTIASHCALAWSLDLPDTADPNRWLHRLFAERHPSATLPRVPRTPNVGHLPGAARLKDWPEPAHPRLVVRHAKDTAFAVAGTVEVGGWKWHAESPVEAAYARGDTKTIAGLKEDLAYLMGCAKTFEAGGEQCVFWEKPIEGRWNDKWGGEPVRSLHNANGFAVGIAMTDVWRHERDGKLLPFIDGVYNWAKHFVWSRNEFPDVPASPFAIGATLPAAFLLDYYFTFKHTPERADRARAALDLALSIAYRCLAAWTGDNDHFDGEDPSFLIEPNSGEAWAGAPCANEVSWYLDTLAQVYVHTGDARLGYLVRGALDRWHLLYRDAVKPSLGDYDRQALTEGWGVFDGSGPGRGQRYEYGWADDLLYAWPFGDAAARVVCGERAALACVKTAEQFDAADYRSSGDGHFAFRVVSDRKAPFDIALTYPQVNLAKRAVAIVRDGKRLDGAAHVRRPPQAPASLCLRGARNGDTVIVGEPKLDAPPAAVARVLEHEAAPRSNEEISHGDETPFEIHALEHDTVVEADWANPDSWAGFPAGIRWAWGVPLRLADPRANGGRIARAGRVKFDRPVAGPATLFLAFAETQKNARFGLYFDNGTKGIASADPALAWRSWPPLFKKRLLVMPVSVPPLRKLEAIEPQQALLFALTVHHGDPKNIDAAMTALAEGGENWREEIKLAADLQALKAELERVPRGRIAILPTGPAGPAARYAEKLGLMERADVLTPEQMVEPGVLDAKRHPVALHLGGERYPFTVRAEGDGRAALVDYLRSGGLIICAGHQPLPFCYGEDARKGGRAEAGSLLAELGVPLKAAFEEPPRDHVLRYDYATSQRVVDDLPWQVEFPREGDLRLRSVDADAVDEALIRYQRIYSVVDEHGNDYGDAAASIEWRRGPASGGRLLYFWFRLLDDAETGNRTLSALFHYAIKQAKPAPLPMKGRRR